MKKPTTRATQGRPEIDLKRFGEPLRIEPAHFPPGLDEMRESPSCVFAWGELPPPPWVSIVGTRTPSEDGYREAFLLGKRLASRGVAIASGGALGIDSAAHLGALAAGGRTVVVAPTWLPTAYPKSNHRLFEAVLERKGAYVTVSPPQAKPLAFVFFRRNEALMALSHATVLGECRHQSGAKNAMSHARYLGRPRFVLPFRFGDERASGPRAEVVKEGAEILADEEPVLRQLEEYGNFPNPEWWDYLASLRGKQPEPCEVDPKMSPEKKVLVALRAGDRTIDEICARTALSPGDVQHRVLLLTLAGRVEEDAQGLLRYHSRSP